MKNTKVYLSHIRSGSNGIDVYVATYTLDKPVRNGVYRNVHENIVRCMLGSDYEYFLTAKYERCRELTLQETVDLRRYSK